jgi:hypothetical protein
MEHRELDSMAVGRAPSNGDCWRPQSRRGCWERESRGATPWTLASSLLELGPEEMPRPGWSRGGVGEEGPCPSRSPGETWRVPRHGWPCSLRSACCAWGKNPGREEMAAREK